jgi:hypothetical protein
MPVQPYPKRKGDPYRLDVSCRVSTGPDTWLELNDGHVFVLAEGTFEDEAQPVRKARASGPFTRGSVVTNVVEDNVVAPLNVYVRDATHFDLEESVRKVTDAVMQNQFTIEHTVGNLIRVYACYGSEYTVSTTRPFLHARMALVKVQLERSPVVAFGEEV